MCGYEHLGAEVAYVHLRGARQRMRRWNHKCQLVAVHHNGAELRIVGAKRQHSHLHGVLQHLLGDIAGQGTLHGDPDHGMYPAELVQHRQEIQAGVLVGGDAQLALLQLPQLDERSPGLSAQVEQLLGVFLEHAAGIGEGAVARRTIEQQLAQFGLQLAHELADGRLSSAQALRGPGKALFLNDGQKGFQLCKVHGLFIRPSQ